MWMMGYNDSGGDFNMPPDSFNGRKLRPLIPRPLPSTTTNTTTNNPSAPTPHCLTRMHGTDFFGLNHHLGSHFGEQSKRELNAPPVVVSSRWNPTPEQLRTLEELYRRGTRTPSAEQIQHITAQLRRYGKIEGKNVFYWFQNHKARERQKRRRQMESSASGHHHHDHHSNYNNNNNFDIEIFKESTAASKTDYEVEQTKNWAALTNCSTLPEEYVSVPKSTKAAVAEYNRQGGWIQFDEAAGGELQQHRRSFVERNATWQMMQLSSPTHLTNTNCTTTKTPATTLTAMDRKQLIKAHDLSFFISPYRENGHGFNYRNSVSDEVDGYGESQTLELFPLRSGGDGIDHNVDKVTDVSVAAIDANNLAPYQFFEFLPLKN